MAYPATPKTWVAGDVLTAAQLNAELRAALLGAFPLGPPDVAWTPWTPTFVNMTVGNGTLTAVYSRTGRRIFFYIKFVFGSTSAMGTSPTYTLPVAAAARYDNTTLDVLGTVMILDSATANFAGVSMYGSSTTGVIQVLNASATFVTVNGLSATAPMVWAVNDGFVIYGVYEAAA